MKRLFADVETCQNKGYFWRAGYKLNIPVENILEEKKVICAAWKWEGNKAVFSSKWEPQADLRTFTIGPTTYEGYHLVFDDRPAIEPLIQAMDKADEIVMQNGDKFDVPWLRSRALFHQIPMKPSYKTFDTLKKSRGAFYLNSHRLDYRRKYCGGRGKIKTDYELWYKIQTENHQPSLKYMMKYCSEDVRELEKDFKAIQPYVTHNTHAGVALGRPKWTCAVCGTHDVKHNKEYITAAGTTKHYMKCSKKHTYNISDTEYLRFLKQR